VNKIYYLGTCSTCARIIDELGLRKRKDFVFQDIRTERITPSQITEMKKLAGSYEALFSRVALKYRAMKLNERTLTEKEMRELILEEDTFLKRPVMIIDGKIFIGNTKKNIEAAKAALK
jgi:arsenate reductase (glutaredoxin)